MRSSKAALDKTAFYEFGEMFIGKGVMRDRRLRKMISQLLKGKEDKALFKLAWEEMTKVSEDSTDIEYSFEDRRFGFMKELEKGQDSELEDLENDVAALRIASAVRCSG